MGDRGYTTRREKMEGDQMATTVKHFQGDQRVGQGRFCQGGE